MEARIDLMMTESLAIDSEKELIDLLKEFSRVDDGQEFTNKRTSSNIVIFDDEEEYYFVAFGEIEERLDVYNIALDILEDVPPELRPLLFHDRIHFRIMDNRGRDIGEKLLEYGPPLFHQIIIPLLDVKNEQDFCCLHFLHVDEGFFGFHLHTIKLFA